MIREPHITIDADLTSEMLGNVRRTLTAAASSLSLDEINLRVGETAKLRRLGLIAAVTTDGEILVSERLFEEDGTYAAAALLEEAAHLKLIRCGVVESSESFASALIHESYATWYVFWELLQRVPTIAQRFEDGPIPSGDATPELGYGLGAFVGAAVAGIPAARGRLTRFHLQGVAAPGVKELAARVERVIVESDGPVDAAIALARMY